MLDENKHRAPFPFALRMRELDIKRRDIYIAIACDIERMMDDIIGKCEIDERLERRNFKFEKIISLEMGKIKQVHEGRRKI